MRKISGGWDREKREAQFETLLKFLAECKSDDQIRAVLETLVTSSEKAAIAQRLAIIRLLNKGAKYYDIRYELRVSPNTITKTLDLYHKHGEHNKTFNVLLAGFKFEPRRIEPKATYHDPQKQNAAGGVREFLRQEAKARKKFGK